jgi:hypothetical protein
MMVSPIRDKLADALVTMYETPVTMQINWDADRIKKVTP